LARRPPSRPRAGSRRCTGTVSPPVSVSAHQLAGAPRACVPAPVTARAQPPPPSQRLAAVAGVQSALPSRLQASAAAAASRMCTGCRRARQRQQRRPHRHPRRVCRNAASNLRSLHASRPLLHARVAKRSPLAASAAARCAPLPSPQQHLRALQPPPHPVADSFTAQLHRIWTPSPRPRPFARPAHPAHHRLAPPASERSLPRRPPALHPSSAQLPGARAARGSPARGIHALRRITTSTAALRPASLRRSHENLLQRQGRAPAAPRQPSAPPLPSRRSRASAASVAPAALHAERELHACSQPSQPRQRSFQPLAPRSPRSKHAQHTIQHHASNALASSHPCQTTMPQCAAHATLVSPSIAAPHRTAQPLSAPPQRIHAPPPPPTATPSEPNPPAARHPPINAPIHPPEHPPDRFTPRQRTTRQRRC
jgi:hypothetical protein